MCSEAVIGCREWVDIRIIATETLLLKVLVTSNHIKFPKWTPFHSIQTSRRCTHICCTHHSNSVRLPISTSHKPIFQDHRAGHNGPILWSPRWTHPKHWDFCLLSILKTKVCCAGVITLVKLWVHAQYSTRNSCKVSVLCWRLLSK
jgi:hypothetical protein